jgi:HK97 family phage prohead protease
MSAVELREASGGESVLLETLASVTGVWYPIAPNIEERIVPGAFKRSLAAGPEMVLVINHGQAGGLPLAHTKGTPPLEVEEIARGLQARAELNPRDPDVQSLRAKAETMPLQASFSFRCNRDRWNADETRREVLEVNLSKADITITPWGANPATATTIRGAVLTLEQRQAFRERITGRVIGPGLIDRERLRTGRITDAEMASIVAQGRIVGDRARATLSRGGYTRSAKLSRRRK